MFWARGNPYTFKEKFPFIKLTKPAKNKGKNCRVIYTLNKLWRYRACTARRLSLERNTVIDSSGESYLTMRLQTGFRFPSIAQKLKGSLRTRRFWATDYHWKWAVFLFNLSWHYHIYIIKSHNRFLQIEASSFKIWERQEDKHPGMRNVHFRLHSAAQKRRLLTVSIVFARTPLYFLLLTSLWKRCKGYDWHTLPSYLPTLSLI